MLAELQPLCLFITHSEVVSRATPMSADDLDAEWKRPMRRHPVPNLVVTTGSARRRRTRPRPVASATPGNERRDERGDDGNGEVDEEVEVVGAAGSRWGLRRFSGSTVASAKGEVLGLPEERERLETSVRGKERRWASRVERSRSGLEFGVG